MKYIIRQSIIKKWYKRRERVIIKKVFVILSAVICIAAGLLIWKSRYSTPVKAVKTDTGTPKGVVEAYFAYSNAKNTEKMQSLFTARYKEPNIVWPSLNGLQYVKVKSIKEITDKALREGYSMYGPGRLKGVKDEDFVMYRVEYEEKYRFHKAEFYTKELTIMREDAGSPWLIDEFGET